VVLATNIAETSLTIEDVVYVVDTGKLKARAGRARTRPGSTLSIAKSALLDAVALLLHKGPCVLVGRCCVAAAQSLGPPGSPASRGAARRRSAATTPAAA
jgi:hypothetical protein